MTNYRSSMIRRAERENGRPSFVRRYGPSLLLAGGLAATYLGSSDVRNYINNSATAVSRAADRTGDVVTEGITSFIPRVPDSLFAPERWHSVKYTGRSLWDYYMGEVGIERSAGLWQRYCFEVERVNRERGNPLGKNNHPPGWNEGTAQIWLPDLNRNRTSGE